MMKTQFITDETRWQAVAANDAAADGVFYYAVTSTGVYCRPSCSSRLPRRSNVEYFTRCADAEEKGFRPCKRCKPGSLSKEEEARDIIISACRIIEAAERQPKLADLASQVNLSPYHFHRLFKKIVGVTPKQYAKRHLAAQFQKDLNTSPSITDAIYSAGFSSSGSAYDKEQDQLAMKPKDYRKGGGGLQIQYGCGHCYLGWVIVAATDRGICAIEFGDDKASLPEKIQERFPKASLTKAGSSFDHLLREVIAFIKAPKETFQLPLDIQGTAFQQRVWHILKQIKPGETLSYSDVARKLGKPDAYRAVATACGSNKIAVVIPCHRVISKGGKVSGYRWGSDRKKKLLDCEKEIIEE